MPIDASPETEFTDASPPTESSATSPETDLMLASPVTSWKRTSPAVLCTSAPSNTPVPFTSAPSVTTSTDEPVGTRIATLTDGLLPEDDAHLRPAPAAEPEPVLNVDEELGSSTPASQLDRGLFGCLRPPSSFALHLDGGLGDVCGFDVDDPGGRADDEIDRPVDRECLASHRRHPPTLLGRLTGLSSSASGDDGRRSTSRSPDM